MKVVYGHTDSIYVKMPMDKTEETLNILNTHVRKQFPNLLELKEHPVKLELEKYFSTLGVGYTKNRNAGLISWKDGKYLEPNEFTMTGFTAKRLSVTPIEKEVQLHILDMWVNNKPKEEIDKYCNIIYNQVLNNETPLSKLVKRSRFRPERLKAMCKTCKKIYTFKELHKLAKKTMRLRDKVSFKNKGSITHFCVKCSRPFIVGLTTIEGKRITIGSGIEGIICYNQNNEHPIDDSYVFIKIIDSDETYMHPITEKIIIPKWASATKLEDLNKYKIDTQHYANTIVKKADPIYKAMEWDTVNITFDNKQKTLDEWW